VFETSYNQFYRAGIMMLTGFLDDKAQQIRVA